MHGVLSHGSGAHTFRWDQVICAPHWLVHHFSAGRQGGLSLLESAFTWQYFFQMDVYKHCDLQKKDCCHFFQPVRIKHRHFLSLLSSERLRAASAVEQWNQTKAGLCPWGSKWCWNRAGGDLPRISGLKIPAEGRCTSSGLLVLAHDCPHMAAGPLILLSGSALSEISLMWITDEPCSAMTWNPGALSSTAGF